MVSKSNRRKSNSPSRDVLVELFQDGHSVINPNAVHCNAAKFLEGKGLVTLTENVFVKCVNPRDHDLPRGNRSCNGRIYVDTDVDEDGGDYRCDVCGRIVYPFKKRKQRFRELHVAHSRPGITAFVSETLVTSGLEITSTGSDAAFYVHGKGISDRVVLAILDFDDRSKFFNRENALVNPTLILVVDSDRLQHVMLNEGWICRADLADALLANDLDKRVRECSATPPPDTTPALSIPIAPTRHQPRKPEIDDSPGYALVVEVTDQGMKVMNVDIPGPVPTLGLLRDVFLEDFLEAKPAKLFRTLDTSTIAAKVAELTDAPEPLGDEDVRRPINRARKEARDRVKATFGFPIDSDSIIQNIDGGYRFNPEKVAMRPKQKK